MLHKWSFSNLDGRCDVIYRKFQNIIRQNYRARCPLQDVYFAISALCRIRALLPWNVRRFLTLRLWPWITLKPFGLESWNLVGLWGPMAPTVNFSETLVAVIGFEKSGIYCTIGFMHRRPYVTCIAWRRHGNDTWRNAVVAARRIYGPLCIIKWH